MDQQPNNQTPAPKERFVFRNLMTRGEKIAGWIWLPVHVVALPLFLPLLMYLLSGKQSVPDSVTLNIWYFLISLVFLFITQFRFFRDSYHVLTHNFRRAVTAMLMSWFMLMVGNVALQTIMDLFGGMPGSPNDDALNDLLQQDMRRMVAAAVIMAPIVEEVLFRGLIFGSIRGKSRVLAYIVSMVLFGLFHVWQYAVAGQSLAPLLSGFAYLPIAFVLAFCYDYSGSIWTPIFFHMFYNAVALSMR